MGVMSCSFHNSFLVLRWGAALHGGHEASADPDGVGTQGERHRQTTAVVDAACRNDGHLLSGQGSQFALAEVDNHGDEDAGGNFSGVATTFPTLSAYDVNTRIKCLLNVVGRANHVHHGNASSVQLVNRVLGRHTHGADEQLSPLIDNDINQFWKLPFGVV